jgi:hypothetical protein
MSEEGIKWTSRFHIRAGDIVGKHYVTSPWVYEIIGSELNGLTVYAYPRLSGGEIYYCDPPNRPIVYGTLDKPQ